MGKASQRKGRRGEIELRDRLKQFGYEVQIGEPQSYGADPDLTGLPGVHVEAKRCEKICIPEWLRQASRDAVKFGDGLPAVFHRQNRTDWAVTMTLSDWIRLYQAAAECGAVTSGKAGEYENTSET